MNIVKKLDAKSNYDIQRLIIFIIGTIITIVLWRTFLLLPFKVFVVFVHESFHALAALITGGDVLMIDVSWNESGYTTTQGGFFVIIASAGYLGSALFGGAVLYFSKFKNLIRIICYVIGIGIILLSFLYCKDSTLIFGLITGILFIIGGVYSKYKIVLYLLQFIGIMSCLYSIYDFGDYLIGNPEKTDAGILANYFGISFLAYPIGICWSIISLIILFVSIKGSLRKTEAKK